MHSKGAWLKGIRQAGGGVVRCDAQGRGSWTHGAGLRAQERKVMSKALEGLTQAALLFAGMFVLVAIGLVLVRKFRGRSEQTVRDVHEMMTNFRELHRRGGLSDEEFRTIKSKLALEVKAEVKDEAGAG